MVDHLSAVTAGMIVQTDMATLGLGLRFHAARARHDETGW